MYNYNQTKQVTGTHLPLLMGYTQPEKIREAENDVRVEYDPVRQIAIVKPFIMRTVGTKSLKTSSTKKGHTAVVDRKNEIDDSKSV